MHAVSVDIFDVDSSTITPNLCAARRQSADSKNRITYMHGLAEHTGFPDHSWDMVTHQFVIHECPQSTINDFTVEGKRILRPGGVLCFVDNNPR